MYKFLIVVDMQNDFIDGVLGSSEAQAIVPKVCEKIESRKFDDIFITLDEHTNELYPHQEESRYLPIHCIKGTEGAHLNFKVSEAIRNVIHKIEEEDIFHKNTFCSFELGKTLQWITSLSGAEIEIVGLCTDICVISTVLMLRSMLPEVRIAIDSSCCAGTTPEKHKAALEVAKSCLIDVI